MADGSMPSAPAERPLPETLPERFVIRVEGSDASFTCRGDQRVLEALNATWFGPGGSKRPDLKVGCRRGGCGVCRVQVLAGDYDTDAMSAAFVDDQERCAGYALACCIFPRSDLLLRPARKARAAAER